MYGLKSQKSESGWNNHMIQKSPVLYGDNEIQDELSSTDKFQDIQRMTYRECLYQKKKVDRIHVTQDVGKRECQILFPRGVNFNIYMEISSLYSLTSRQQ